MYTVYGGIGSHEAVTVTFSGGDRTTCLVIHKPDTGEAQIKLVTKKMKQFE